MHCYMRVSKVTIKVADSIALFLNRVVRCTDDKFVRRDQCTARVNLVANHSVVKAALSSYNDDFIHMVSSLTACFGI